MCSTIHHRGPDGAGFAILNKHQLGLAHVRLSIVDLEGGQQPMSTPDQRTWISFNGEIYDYQSQRETLKKYGYPFKTQSDTEVILAAYSRWGKECVHHLNGEFAFVIWDTENQTLFAARDPVGVKPLFFLKTSDELVLCSEAKGILSLDHVSRQISADYLCGPMMGVYKGDESAFKDVKSLKPGHTLTATADGEIVESPWWKPRYRPDPSMSFHDAKEGVRRELTQAVKRRRVADVSVHAYLSGGLDSTLICGLMARDNPNFTAYNIGFGKSVYDESSLARQIADHFGVQIETVQFSNEDLSRGLEETVFHTESVVANPNSVAKKTLSGLVRSQKNKVCLTGEGADEIFAGYPYFKMEALWRMMKESGASPTKARGLWRRFQKMEYRSKGLGWYPGIRWEAHEASFGYPCFQQIRVDKIKGAHRKLFNLDNFEFSDQQDPAAIFSQVYAPSSMEALHPINASKTIAVQQLSGYLIPNLGDRVEMANSLECRTPFLDTQLMRYVETVPPEYFLNIDTLREKYLLHEAFGDLLPPLMQTVHKHPFLAPSWTRFAQSSGGRELFGDFLSPWSLRSSGIFNEKVVRAMHFAWKLTPAGSLIRKQLDLSMGSILSAQILDHLFVNQKVPSDPEYSMVDYSPRV